MKRLLLLCAAAAIGCGGGGETTAPITSPPPSDTTSQSLRGFDIGVYPGDFALTAWRYPSSPYRWVGYYLAAPCHRDTTFVGKRATIAAMGWGLAAIYVGQQDWAAMASLADRVELMEAVTCSASLLSTAQGSAEAADAVAGMRANGFADGSVVYLDIEHVTVVSQALIDYYRAWTSGVLADGHYKPGIYATKSNAPTFYNVPITDVSGAPYTPPFWIASSVGFTTSSKPTDVGLPYARIWQGMLDVPQTWNGVTLRIDVDASSTLSPSASP